jgi:hypothetical protein
MYSSTSSNLVTIDAINDGDGSCVREFPMDISENFFQATVEGDSPISLVCGRDIFHPNNLYCRNVRLSNLTGVNTNIMISIY